MLAPSLQKMPTLSAPNLCCAVAFSLVFLAACGPRGERPLQGYIEGEHVRVGPQFAGTLQQLSVQRGDQVVAGTPLFVLERDNEIAARAQAEEQLRSALARLENIKTGKRPPEVETVAEQLRQAQASRELSAANLKRQESLFRSGFISDSALDDARTKLKSDDALVAQLKESVQTANLPGRPTKFAPRKQTPKRHAKRWRRPIGTWRSGRWSRRSRPVSTTRITLSAISFRRAARW
jgi:HlyD family secretion protein